MNDRGCEHGSATSYGVFGVVLSVDGTLKVQPPLAFATAAEATRMAEFLAGALGGAVAFARNVDPRSGAMKDGAIIAKCGLMADRRTVTAKAA